MTQINKSLRFEILTRDGYRCRYCGATAQTAVLHVDHVVSKSKGGRDDVANLVTACSDCNHGKTDRQIVGIPAGFALTPDPRPARLKKLRERQAAKLSFDEHILDCSCISEFDEIDCDTQLCWVWCQTHEKLEWHSLPLDFVEMQDGIYRTTRKEVSW